MERLKFGESAPHDCRVPRNGQDRSRNEHLPTIALENIVPIVFSYHSDIDDRLSTRLNQVRLLDHRQHGFNPMHIETATPTAHVDSAGMLRDVFAAMFPDLGDIQLERLRTAIRNSYVRHGWGTSTDQVPTIPDFREFYTQLKSEPKPRKELLARLDELDDYHFLKTVEMYEVFLILKFQWSYRSTRPRMKWFQRATAMIVFLISTRDVFVGSSKSHYSRGCVRRGTSTSKMKLLPKLAAECRKFGISLILASQSAKDFDTALFSKRRKLSAVALADQDAAVLAKNINYLRSIKTNL